jgi:hypothetical protein
VADIFLQFPAVPLPSLRVARHGHTGGIRSPVNESRVAHVMAQRWLCLGC